MNNEHTLAISEMFLSIQGEGPDVGKPAIFVRVQHCPVQCPGCDTAYAWAAGQPHAVMSYDEIGIRLAALAKDSCVERLGLVLTGGEPLLYYRKPELAALVRRWPGWTALETSGFIGAQEINYEDLAMFLLSFNTVVVSPKVTPCLHGKQSTLDLERDLSTVLRTATGTVCTKFVVRDELDLAAVAQCVSRHDLMRWPVYLMPYGTQREEIFRTIEWLVPHAARMGMIVSPRLHSLLWGARRGV